MLDEGMKICDEITNRTEYVIPPRELRSAVETVEKNNNSPSSDNREDVTSESPTAVLSDTQQGVLGDSRGHDKSKVINPKLLNPKLKSINLSGADRLNDIIHTDSLADWLFSFEEKWKTVLAENKIKHQRAYMRSCIWNWLCEYRFEQYNDERQIDALFGGR